MHPNNIPDEAISGSHPPAFGYALGKLIEAEGKMDAAHLLMPALLAYNRWFEEHRRSDVYPDLIVARKWSDTGQDNSKRWGELLFLMFGTPEKCWWDFPILPVDLNVLWALQNRIIGQLLSEMGRTEEAEVYTSQAERTEAAIQSEMWDEKSGFYHDIHEESRRHIPVFTPAGFMPLCLGLPSKEQYEALKGHLLNPNKFWTKYPLPTLAADDNEFAPVNSYWRGPVWSYFNHFVLEGLYKYDIKTAEQLLAKNMEMFTHRGFVTAFENYNPLTGDGYNCAHFLWSGLIANSMIEHTCGVRLERGRLTLSADSVPESWNHFRIEQLPVFDTVIDLAFERTTECVRFTVTNKGTRAIQLQDKEKVHELSVGESLTMDKE